MHDASSRSPRTIIIGIGNTDRGDDGVGLHVARALRAADLPGVVVREESADGAALMEAWKGAQAVILVDSVVSGREPGTVFRFEAHAQPLPKRLFSHASTHAIGVTEAIELARALRQLPPRLVVYGIEGRCFAIGAPLSPEVEQAAVEVVRQLQRELSI